MKTQLLKSKWFTALMLTMVVLFLQACDNNAKKEGYQEVLLKGKTMGTTYTVKVFVPLSHVRSLNLYSEIESELEKVNQSMSTYITDSEISQFNRLTADQIFPISKDFRTVIKEAIRLGQSTKTLDVTMGPLINLWGFGPDKKPNKVPSEQMLTDVKQKMGLNKLNLKQSGLTKSIDELQLSFSAIAKGYGVDKVAELLESKDYNNYMVEIGGELRLSGQKPDGNKWAIAIEQPDPNLTERKIHKALKLTDISIATSGDYRIFYELEGTTYSHLISPVTGKPIVQDLVSVTVLNKSSMTADALATALTVMGTEKAKQYAEQNHLAVYLISKTGSGLQTYASPEFIPYL